MSKRVIEGDYAIIKDDDLGMMIVQITDVLDKDPGYKNMRMYQIDKPLLIRGHYGYDIYDEDILNYNSEIINLIKKGDYVNGKEVKKVVTDKESYLDLGDYKVLNKGIKSVVCKEALKYITYNVKGE